MQAKSKKVPHVNLPASQSAIKTSFQALPAVRNGKASAVQKLASPARGLPQKQERSRPTPSPLLDRKDAVQRQIIYKIQNQDFLTAWRAILNSLDGVTNVQRLIDLASHDVIDLVLRSDIAWYSLAQGETGAFALYDPEDPDDKKKNKWLNAAINEARRAGGPLRDKITIVVNAVLPIKFFWNRQVGTLAGTLAHELCIHAAAYVPVIEDLHRNSYAVDLAKWRRDEVFDEPDNHPHHDALKFENTEHPRRAEYRRLTQNLMRYWRGHGDKSNALAVNKQYSDSVWEHTETLTADLMSIWGVTLSDDD